MTESQKIAPCLWFDGKAEEAAEFYVSTFRDSHIEHKLASPTDWPAGKAGDIILVTFVLAGQHYQALNGGPNENGKFNESVSLSVICEDQAEVDRCWEALTADGGMPVMCGWLADKYGLRWQIVPRALTEMMMDNDKVKARRVMEAMMQMV
ncbi:MAG: VOC family protein, partial [Hyphomicrobiaceae bacterium]|nr:VOC family protein [Hyphomicrobiaceae bacterium]